MGSPPFGGPATAEDPGNPAIKPNISAVSEAGNPGNLQRPWKWLPQKERALQNRQFVGFCEVPFISAVPEAGKSQGPWKWPSQKERTLQNRQLWAFVRIPSFQRSQRPEIHEIQKGLGNCFRQKKKTLQNRQLLGFSPFQRSEEPDIQEIQKGLGNGFRNRRGITKSTTFGL